MSKKQKWMIIGVSVAAAVVVVITVSITLGVILSKPNNDTTSSPTTACVDTFQISLEASTCPVDIQTVLGVPSVYTETIVGDKRQIDFNGVANHNVGTFPNSGNPNTIAARPTSVQVPLVPAPAAELTSAAGYDFGVLRSGCAVDPFTAEFFTNDGVANRNWNETTLTSSVNLGLDCNNAHVQPSGEYHVHGTPSAYIAVLIPGGTPTAPVSLGYAADGYEIFYKYVYDATGALVPVESGYMLKSGDRPGNGITAPDGCYDGLYFQDYEYSAAASVLDAANGYTGVTTIGGDQKYFYVFTDNFPSSSIMFRGTPDPSMKHAGP
jgi:hypothetical protein